MRHSANATNSDRMTVLHCAAVSGHIDMIKRFWLSIQNRRSAWKPWALKTSYNEVFCIVVLYPENFEAVPKVVLELLPEVQHSQVVTMFETKNCIALCCQVGQLTSSYSGAITQVRPSRFGLAQTNCQQHHTGNLFKAQPGCGALSVRYCSLHAIPTGSEHRKSFTSENSIMALKFPFGIPRLLGHSWGKNFREWKIPENQELSNCLTTVVSPKHGDIWSLGCLAGTWQRKILCLVSVNQHPPAKSLTKHRFF